MFERMGSLMVSWTQGNLLLTTVVVLWLSALASAIVDYIPKVIAMIPLVKSIVPAFATPLGAAWPPEAIQAQIEAPLFYALPLGARLGGNGSLIGASGNIVIASVAKRNNYKLSFWDFTRYGFPLMILSLIISTSYIYLRYFAWRKVTNARRQELPYLSLCLSGKSRVCVM